ncbi:hypothetical protein M8C21_011261 [Ambrosia artemisiifolia]|uniref:Uncharacterized protein n=1 Tax=Ambrosia artemisiifolia TaxID=4212 RepID=A0AAD5GQ26_AMBAR|nr:hypothetical protein M8C21_011261 [Ambrosia artemisiifolia]
MELALGLERSGQRFVWVVRVADTGDSVGFEESKVELPEGFEERVRGRGLIERSWAPQLEILGHFATGGFMSHCGWNSCMESMSMGVPIVAWPMQFDQPRNAFLITDVLRIGIHVRNWERRNELVKANVVAEVVKTLLVSEEGEEDNLVESSSKQSTSSVPTLDVAPFPVTMNNRIQTDGTSFEALSGSVKHLLDQNNQVLGQISANISLMKLQDNIDLFYHTKNNIAAILNNMRYMPGPPFPVSLNEDLAHSILPTTNQRMMFKAANGMYMKQEPGFQ